MMDTGLPRIHLAFLPTPVEFMPRLSAALGGPRLWIKRDDLTGLAFGGNKTRKLEVLLADAQAQGARALMTCGATQSNHCRQTAAAAARLGLDCVLVLAGGPPSHWTGNALLDRLLGAEIVWAGAEDPRQVLQRVFDESWEQGRRPYLIPFGGSNPLGASAYVEAMAEFMNQGVPVDCVVLATASGGTQAGLVLGARMHGYEGRILGISVDRGAAELKQSIAGLAEETSTLLRQPYDFFPSDIQVVDSYVGGGYGVMSELEKGAIEAFARHEGIVLDPVYTGRAAGGMMDLIRMGQIGSDEDVLFWHTGGTPALFTYADRII